MDDMQKSLPLSGLRVLRRRLPVVVLCLVLVPGAALAYSLTKANEYTATASLLLSEPGADERLLDPRAAAPTVDPVRAAATNLDLVGLEELADRTAVAVGGGLTGRDVSAKVRATAGGRSNVISVKARDSNARRAALLANAFATQFINFRRGAQRAKFVQARRLVNNELVRLGPTERNTPRAAALRRRSDQLAVSAALQTGGVELVQAARAPSSPSSPRPRRNTLIGVCLGLLLGIALALLVDRLDRRVRDPAEIEALIDRPIVGLIPKSGGLSDRSNTESLADQEPAAFGMLRANLRYFNTDRPIRSVLVTSSVAREGKSTVALHLAVAAARSGTRTLLVEADLRVPSITAALNVGGGAGLASVLARELDSDDIVRSLPLSQSLNGAPVVTLDAALAGTMLPPNPTDLVESARMVDFLRSAEEKYDLVVVDSPPMSVPDAISLVRAVDGVVAVVRLGMTTRDSVAHLRKQFQRLDANLLGVVINGATRTADLYGYYAETETSPGMRGLLGPLGRRRTPA